MKGHEIITQIVRTKMPDREQVKDVCVRQTLPEKQRSKRPLLRSLAMTAAAAVVVACFLIGNTLLNPQSENSFSVKAYALEQQANGSISISDHESNSYGGINTCSMNDPDEGYFYRGLYFDIQGENIEKVDLIADNDGRFLIAQILTENGEPVIENYKEYYDDDGKYTGSGGRLVLKSQENLGNSFTLDGVDGMTEDSLLFAGIPSPDGEYIYNLNLTIRAVATFTDGSTQEISLTVN